MYRSLQIGLHAWRGRRQLCFPGSTDARPATARRDREGQNEECWIGRCGVIDRLGVGGVDGADSGLAQRAVGVDARVREFDLVAEQRGEPRAAEGGDTPAVEL